MISTAVHERPNSLVTPDMKKLEYLNTPSIRQRTATVPAVRILFRLPYDQDHGGDTQAESPVIQQDNEITENQQ